MTKAAIVVYEPDLLFSSKIESAGARLGIDVNLVTDFREMAKQLEQVRPRAILLNLDAAQGKLDVLTEFVEKGSFKAVGYYSHVNAPLAAEARRVGINAVFPRGAFASGLERILKELVSGG